MKTKELIRRLQEADPSGEEECVVGSLDIFDVESMPAYWDGPYEVLKRDWDCPYYNVRGGKITTKGKKIVINTLSIEDAIWNEDAHGGHLPVEIDTHYLNPDHNQSYYDMVEEWRKEPREFYEKEEKRREGREKIKKDNG